MGWQYIEYPATVQLLIPRRLKKYDGKCGREINREIVFQKNVEKIQLWSTTILRTG